MSVSDNNLTVMFYLKDEMTDTEIYESVFNIRMEN